MTGSIWPSPDQDRNTGQSFELHLIAVKDLEEVVTKEIITDFIPVAQSPLAARTQRALTFSSDLTTDVNNIQYHTRRVMPRPALVRATILSLQVHYGQSGVHHCTTGNQVYNSALWAIRCTPVHNGQAGLHQCTMVKQVYTSALLAIRDTPVHYGQSGEHQCSMGKQQIELGGREIFSVDLTVCMLQTC